MADSRPDQHASTSGGITTTSSLSTTSRRRRRRGRPTTVLATAMAAMLAALCLGPRASAAVASGSKRCRWQQAAAAFVRPALPGPAASSSSSRIRPQSRWLAAAAPPRVAVSSTSSSNNEAEALPAAEPAPVIEAATTVGPGFRLKKRPRRTVTGGLKNLPICPPAVELLNRALRTAKFLKIDEEKIKNPRQRARKLGALKLDALTKGICKPLKDVIKAYEYELSVLHPFEATLADLTVRARAKQGYGTLPQVLGAVNELRKEVLEVGKKYIALAKNATTKAEAVQFTEEGTAAIEGMVLRDADVILELVEVQKALRKIPIVQLGTPTVVLVGAPNVGKSSIVRAISTGTPEVNNYPFTTRGMTLGHIEYDDWADDKCQVMDTPGVLNRPDGERNEMEALTLASMQHLPTAVMFVLDLTGHSGALSSIENQIQIRNDLRARFPKRPWVDVISKADLPVDDEDPAVALAPPGAIRISTADGTGIAELEARVREMLAEVRDVLAVLRLRPAEE